MDSVEPGDIVEIRRYERRLSGAKHKNYSSEFGLAFVFSTRSPGPMMLADIRWLEDGLWSVVDIDSCHVIIKRYHILVGSSIEDIRDELHRHSK